MTTTNTAITPFKDEAAETEPLLTRTIDNLWRGVSQPWLPILCAILLGLTLLLALLLPQMPGQLSDDPAASARWLSATAENYGLLGSLIAGLGLLNAMNSLLWRLLTVLLGFVLLLHLVRLWLFDRQISRAQQLVAQPAQSGDSPLPLPAYPLLHRSRVAVDALPAAQFEQLQGRLAASFDTLQTGTHPLAEANTETSSEAGNAEAYHIFALRGRRELRLRMVLLGGGLLAMVAFWLLNVAGWRIQTDPLTPLERFRDDWHNVVVEFRIEGDAPVIVAQQPSARVEIALPTTTEPQRSGAVRAVVGPPALLIQSLSPDAELKRPDGASANAVGLLFPSPGSEETLILPQQETVLRVVRRTDAEPLTFAIESIQANAGESNRFTINSDETRTIRLGEEEVKLRFLPLYSRQVEITSLPGGWLLWPALVLCVIGLWGLRRKPAFTLVQIAPWHTDRSVMIVQGSEEN